MAHPMHLTDIWSDEVWQRNVETFDVSVFGWLGAFHVVDQNPGYLAYIEDHSTWLYWGFKQGMIRIPSNQPV